MSVWTGTRVPVNTGVPLRTSGFTSTTEDFLGMGMTSGAILHHPAAPCGQSMGVANARLQPRRHQTISYAAVGCKSMLDSGPSTIRRLQRWLASLGALSVVLCEKEPAM